jgi:hypothetical protein
LRYEAFLQQSFYIDAISVPYPAQPPRCHASDSPRDASLAQFVIFFLEQAKQRTVDVAQAEQTKIVGANDLSPRRRRGQDALGTAGNILRAVLSARLDGRDVGPPSFNGETPAPDSLHFCQPMVVVCSG